MLLENLILSALSASNVGPPLVGCDRCIILHSACAFNPRLNVVEAIFWSVV